MRTQQLYGALFAGSSLMTPFFLGTAIGAVATGRVRAGTTGDELGSWTSLTALLTGGLFVAACAYVGAIYLLVDARRQDQADMAAYFRVRAGAAAVLTGALAAVTLLELNRSARYVFDRLLGPALPLVAVSVAAGVAALVLIALRRTPGLRVLAATAVAGVVGGWGWAQYPYLLPTSLDLRSGAAPAAASLAELAILGLTVALVGPSFAALYWLQQHDLLGESDTTESLREAVAAEQRPAVATEPPARSHPFVVGVVVAAAGIDILRDALTRTRARRKGRR